MSAAERGHIATVSSLLFVVGVYISIQNKVNTTVFLAVFMYPYIMNI